MGAMIGNRAGVKNPATDGLTFLDKAASLGNPPALTERRQMVFFINADKRFAVGHHADACKTEHDPKSNSHQPHHCRCWSG